MKRALVFSPYGGADTRRGTVMRNLFSVMALLAALAMIALPAATSQGPAKRSPAGQPQRRQRPYYEDDRFAARRSYPGQVLAARALLDEVEKQAQAHLLIEKRWVLRRVGIAAKDIPAAELMDGLEVAFAGRWSYSPQAYVLAASERAAQLIVRQEQEGVAADGGPNDFSRAASQRFRAPVDSFTPEQWAKMEGGEKLEAKDLSPQQWGLLRDAMVLDMRDPSGPHMPTPRPLALEGHAQFWIDSRRQSVEIAYPTVDSSADGMSCMGVLVDKGADGRWRITDGRPRTGKARPAWAEKDDDGPQDYHRDARLQGRLKSTSGTLKGEDLLPLLYEQVEAPFLMQGEWLSKPLPFPVHQRPVTRVMEELEKLARGHWEAVGPMWVLAPGPRPAKPAPRRQLPPTTRTSPAPSP
jgi:hypothetical protein